MIHSPPYPSEGPFAVASVYVAERVISFAILVDGVEMLDDGIVNVVEYESIERVEKGSLNPVEIKPGTRLNKLQPLIATLWERMGKRAKRAFLSHQLVGAKEHLDQCQQLLDKLEG